MNRAIVSDARKMILFLDTPRAGDGLNHRFLVAAPDECDEREIVRFAESAREHATGRDYIAVARNVSQVSRGQLRDGRELLVLAGISATQSGNTERLRTRLTEMLGAIQHAEASLQTNSAGLLVPSAQIASFERELRDYVALAESSPASTTRRPRRTMLALVALILAAVVFKLTQCGKEGGEKFSPPEGGNTSAQPDAIPLSRAWLDAQNENDRKQLGEFWDAINKKTPRPPAELSEIIGKWAKALTELSQEDDEIRNHLGEEQRKVLSAPAGSNAAKSDMDRFNVVAGFLGGELFQRRVEEAVGGENFQRNFWDKRLEFLRVTGGDKATKLPVSAQQFCKKLSDAVQSGAQ